MWFQTVHLARDGRTKAPSHLTTLSDSAWYRKVRHIRPIRCVAKQPPAKAHSTGSPILHPSSQHSIASFLRPFGLLPCYITCASKCDSYCIKLTARSSRAQRALAPRDRFSLAHIGRRFDNAQHCLNCGSSSDEYENVIRGRT